MLFYFPWKHESGILPALLCADQLSKHRWKAQAFQPVAQKLSTTYPSPKFSSPPPARVAPVERYAISPSVPALLKSSFFHVEEAVAFSAGVAFLEAADSCGSPQPTGPWSFFSTWVGKESLRFSVALAAALFWLVAMGTLRSCSVQRLASGW